MSTISVPSTPVIKPVGSTTPVLANNVTTSYSSAQSQGGSFSQILAQEVSAKNPAYTSASQQQLQYKAQTANQQSANATASPPSSDSGTTNNTSRSDTSSNTTTQSTASTPATKKNTQNSTTTSSDSATSGSNNSSASATVTDTSAAAAAAAATALAASNNATTASALASGAQNTAENAINTATTTANGQNFAPQLTAQTATAAALQIAAQAALKSNSKISALITSANPYSATATKGGMANASNTIPSVLTNATSPITDVAQLSAQTNTDTAANLSAALSGDSSGQANALSANLASSLSALTAKSDTPSALTPEQMAAMSPLQMTANQPLASSDKLTPNVGSPAWDQALGTKVTWMVAGGQQNATLNLNPPDLGPMQVVINVTNAHANASFTAHQPEVRAALENAIPKLREMLGQAGIQLGECSVGGQQAQFQQQNPSSSQQTNSGRTSNASLSDSIGGIAGIVGDIGPRTGSTQRGNGLVDTFV